VRAEIYKWIQDKLTELVDLSGLDSVPTDHLSMFIPTVGNPSPRGWDVGPGGGERETNEGITRLPTKPRIYVRGGKPPKQIGIKRSKVGPTTDVEPVPGGNGQKPKPKPPKHDLPGKRPSPDPDDGPMGKAIELVNVRVFCTDAETGRYRCLIEPTVGGEGFVTLRAVGDERQSALEEAVKIKEWFSSGKSMKPGFNGSVGPVKFEAGKRFAVEFCLEEAGRYALEVNGYAK
jgi:hypothetical protein